jgi:hypothetical protein
LHLAEEARRDLDGVRTRPDRAIHAVRTRMKNLRAILLLLKRSVPKESRKAIKILAVNLKDAFAAQRDAFVVAQLRAKLDGHERAAPRPEKAAASDGKHKEVKAEIARLIRLISKLAIKGLTWEGVLGLYVKRYRVARQAMQECLRRPSAESFHKWRRPVKDLFYQSQVLQPLAGMKTRRLRADRLGDRLGKLNDLQMLHAGITKSSANGLARRIAKKQKAARVEIFKVARKLFAEQPQEIAREMERCVKFHPALAAQAVRQA